VPLPRLDEAVAEFTAAIDKHSAQVIAAGKQAFYRQVDLGLASAYEFAGARMADNLVSPEAHEGIDAFAAKRPPEWKR